MSSSPAKNELPGIAFDAPACVDGMHERRAHLPKRAYLIPSLLTRHQATLVRRLAESDPTAQFARDPDTVDRLPTFECAVFDGGQPVATSVCRVLEPVVTERLLPYLRKRFDCSTLELSQALIRRYLPTERREHPAHFDAHATATVVVSLCDPEDYVGGYYARTCVEIKFQAPHVIDATLAPNSLVDFHRRNRWQTRRRRATRH